MFQFSCRFDFLSTFLFSNRTPKITRILTLYQANTAISSYTVSKLGPFLRHSVVKLTYAKNTTENKIK